MKIKWNDHKNKIISFCFPLLIPEWKKNQIYNVPGDSIRREKKSLLKTIHIFSSISYWNHFFNLLKVNKNIFHTNLMIHVHKISLPKKHKSNLKFLFFLSPSSSCFLTIGCHLMEQNWSMDIFGIYCKIIGFLKILTCKSSNRGI